MSDYSATTNAYMNLAAQKADSAYKNSYLQSNGLYNPTTTYSNSVFTTPNTTYANNNVNFTGDAQDVAAVSADSACTDGSDDGKLGFGETVGNFFKGLVSPITSMFESPGNFIKGVAIMGGCALLCAATGGAAAPLLVAAGVGMGGFQAVKGAVGAATAKTDAEAKEAWQSIGCGTGMIAASVIGAKSAAKAAEKAGVEVFEGAAGENWGFFKSTKACITNVGKSASASLEAFTSGAWKTNLGLVKGGNKNGANETEETLKQKDMTPEQKAEKLKTDAAKQEVNAETQRQQQYEYNKNHKAQHEAELQKQYEEAQTQSEVGKKAVEKGKSYSEQKSENRKNRTHDNKKVANEGAREARNNQLQQQTDATKNNPSRINDINKQLKKATGQAKYADTQEGAIEAYENANRLATEAETLAKQTREYANANPKNQNLQRMAANQEANAQQARAYADSASNAAEARISKLQEIEQSAGQKTNPYEKMIEEGANPEGVEKMRVNSEKAGANKQMRQTKQYNGKVQNKMNEFKRRRITPETLEKIASGRSPKYDDIDMQAAKNLLAQNTTSNNGQVVADISQTKASSAA